MLGAKGSGHGAGTFKLQALKVSGGIAKDAPITSHIDSQKSAVCIYQSKEDYKECALMTTCFPSV